MSSETLSTILHPNSKLDHNSKATITLSTNKLNIKQFNLIYNLQLQNNLQLQYIYSTAMTASTFCNTISITRHGNFTEKGVRMIIPLHE